MKIFANPGYLLLREFYDFLIPVLCKIVICWLLYNVFLLKLNVIL